MPAVKKFTVTPLTFDAKLAEKVAARRAQGETVAAIAKDLNLGAGKVAMAELVATTKRVEQADAAKLARAVVKDRHAGDSWGKLAARYGITEGTARAAYEAASGKSYGSVDLRKRQEA